MTFKTFLLAGACAIGFSGAALAANASVVDTISASLTAQGYTQLHIENRANSVKVEAKGPNGTVEFVYDAAGNLVREHHAGTGKDSTSGRKDAHSKDARRDAHGKDHGKHDHGKHDHGNDRKGAR